MKRMFFAALLIMVISSAALAREFVAGGKSFTALGDYKIEKADKPVIINGQELKTYIISYQNSPMEVTVAIKKGDQCLNYVVLSDILSVQYVCNESYFGVEKLDKSLKMEGLSTSDVNLNRTEYFRQKVLTHGKNGEVFNTQLIASYFPMLIQNSEDIVAETR